MNQTEQALLDAIKKALFGAEVQFPADTDWSAVLQEARNQAVAGIAAQGAPEGIRLQWRNESAAVIATYVRVLHTQKELVDLFAQNKIPIAILKGTAAAVYYPNPSIRSFGDIDCIVPQDRFDISRHILRNNAYSEEENRKGSRHISYHKNGVTIELHHHFSYEGLGMEEFIQDGFDHLERKTIDGVEVPMLPKLANGMVLLMHMCQHLKSGLGLRQLIDWMMYVQAVLDDTYWEEEFEQAADRIGLVALAKTATKTCQTYLGLHDSIGWCRDAEDELCDGLLESLMTSGNFGRKQGLDAKAEAVATDINRIGFFQKLQKSGELNWKAYKRYPRLKPFCWLYQSFRYTKQLVQSRKDIHLVKDKARADKRTELLRKLNIS